ncbi:dihydropteroate synthase [Helicobacter kayseriensis]|uniref:dihydropteroate synthase n=1 Tax=Helicobacter kayseriensis TaxID=2905877 RepID=UPI001E2CDECB|nr:dihydropteroate synthase [Helicobacter kayseriensis]MCE3047707.1 dihydropteroate synthase [Helicobacter kayseriensis]MCE3049055.1 dihydropteroate synthase [Helicobacter kayseriensis]
MKPFIQRIHPSLLELHLQDIQTDPAGQKIIKQKSHDFVFKIYCLPLSAMHILKQEALSVGADLATPKEAILCQKSHYDTILLGSFSQIRRIIQKCQIQPFGLKQLAKTLSTHLASTISLSPQLMAILNLTPDSFYEGSRFDVQKAIQTIQRYIHLGVKIIDIGGASSKPHSELIDPQEELDRLRELITLIYQKNLYRKVLFSIDTYNPEVADFALSHGFKILNDILGFSNPKMKEICAKHNAQAILMHSRGTPKTMQTLTHYHNLFEEIDSYFETKIHELQKYGIQNIILDIGFGFAKDLEHNLSLIQNLLHFKRFQYPLLVGASRKNTIGLLTQQPIHKRLSGTLALHHIAIQNGADILRVHDIEEHIDLLQIHQAMGKLWKK